MEECSVLDAMMLPFIFRVNTSQIYDNNVFMNSDYISLYFNIQYVTYYVVIVIIRYIYS